MADTDSKKQENDKTAEADKKPIEIDPSHTFAFYCRPGNFTKIISNMKLIFASWALFGYCV